MSSDHLGRAPAGEPAADFARGYFILVLVAIGVFQAAQVVRGYYLDADDWFVLEMGRAVCEGPRFDHLSRLWTDEPTWRPLLTLRAGLEWCLFGAAPFPRYLVNVALHGLCAYWLAGVAGSLGLSAGVRWATALLYVAHPIHGEALGWFHSGFEGITVDALLLGALRLASLGHRAAALSVFQLALFTRENALVFVPVVGALAALRGLPGQRLRVAVAAMAPAVAVVVANIVLRVLVVRADAAATGVGSFHLVESPGAALLTTLLHPWVPVHPALEGRIGLWLMLLSLPVGLLAIGGRSGLRVLGICLGVYALLAAPFVPVFHEATRFLEAAPGGIEQRWYFFHLPVAALVVWPAVVLSRRFPCRAFALLVAALTGLFLVVQLLDTRWWVQRSVAAERMADTVDAAVRAGSRSVGVRVSGETDADELAEQVFLNAATRLGAGSRGLRVVHRRDGRLEEARHGSRLGRKWGALLDEPPPGTRWWRVDALGETLVSDGP